MGRVDPDEDACDEPGLSNTEGLLRTPSIRSLMDALDLSGDRVKETGVEIDGRLDSGSGSGDMELIVLGDLAAGDADSWRFRVFLRGGEKLADGFLDIGKLLRVFARARPRFFAPP